MNGDDVRRWVENHRRDATEAISAAMALLRYHEALHGSPFDRQDAVTRREDDIDVALLTTTSLAGQTTTERNGKRDWRSVQKNTRAFRARGGAPR